MWNSDGGVAWTLADSSLRNVHWPCTRPVQHGESWLSHDLQRLLGYSEWRNFDTVNPRSKTACEVSSYPAVDHFVGVNTMVDLGSGSQRQANNLILTRYTCYPAVTTSTFKKA